MKMNFDLELILKMINEEGKMLKDIQEYYGCTRNQLSWFTRKHGLNFRNNKNARKNQSKLMNGDMNPTKGRKRDPKEMQGIAKATMLKTEKEWDIKFEDGITYKQYSKICRSLASKHFKGQTVKNEIEIDHIFSLKDCWENKINPRITSHKNNLRLIEAKENREKGANSLITLEEFLSITGGQRLSKAQFNWKRVE